MSDEVAPSVELPPRARKILSLVYAIEGVASARVWIWSDKVAVGVRPTSAIASDELLRRVSSAVAPLREIDEVWEFGLLEDT